ncbi:glycoside hydrolase family 73 protein [Companilactobacillus metriopterae]|uniref:glycoside hydrolase family 73 protein n=1 Tax=Companilactobacillus metriopterae TaxID=1909267 RepID=UPI00100B7771|nr:glycoside hydrolase family 73 protein [Companilactobacillus metriopterae]
MKKKWLASTALAGLITSVGASTATQAVRASDTSNDTDSQSPSQSSTGKDTSVASVMDETGAPVTTPEEASAANAGDASLAASMGRSAVEAVTQAAATKAATPQEQQAFLATAVPLAQQMAAKYNIYASVMLAQAILESSWGQSLLATEAHNLFGMKGDYNGNYYTIQTGEWSQEQGYYYISANFRKYPSWTESFGDNGNKIRNGVSWDSTYYSGAWKENAATYKDATQALQGKYATSPTYAQSLNNVIETYNLTQYDTNTSTGNNNGGSTGGDTNSGSSAVVNGTQTPMDDVAVVVNKNTAHLYIDAYPNQSSNRALGYGTPWKVASKVVTSDGSVYYQVSTHEYVKASDVKLNSSTSSATQAPEKISDIAKISSVRGATVYSSPDLSSTTSRVLPYQSDWVTTAYVLDEDGNKFYMVGKNAYILADDVTLNSEAGSTQSSANEGEDTIVSYPDVVTVTASPSAKLYDDNHKLLQVSLANKTDWKIDKKSTHADGSVWYRVASNQWVSADNVQVKGTNYVKTVSGSVKINYIPGYAVNVYNSPAVNNQFTGNRLSDGTTWDVTSMQIVDGQTWYEVPGGWVNGKYCIYTAN